MDFVGFCFHPLSVFPVFSFLGYLADVDLGIEVGGKCFAVVTEYYGAAESMLGVSAILGSVAAGLLTGKLKMRKLSLVLAALGAFLVPAGIVFLVPAGTITRYVINVTAFCGVQMAACIFSIFALSYIQQKTPNHLIGKVMAYISTISICAQPIGQTIYGLLFDGLSDAVYLVLIPTGMIVCMIGLFATGFFRKLDSK